MNLFEMLERSARSRLGARRAISFEGDERSFATIRDRSLRLARGLHGAGVQPGDRVAVLMGNRHEWPETLFGIAALGAVCVPVNVLLTGRELRHVCERRHRKRSPTRSSPSGISRPSPRATTS